MENMTVRNELTGLNRSAAKLRYAGENVWYSERAEYAGLTGKLTEIVKEKNIRGSVLLATDDEIIWAAGARSKETGGGTVTPLTTYEIGSITKMITAVCVFRLVEEGSLRLTDKVRQFFPAYDKAGEMMVWDLLHMRAGIVDFANETEVFFGGDQAKEEAFNKGLISDEELLAHLYQLDLKFVPGSEMRYSNTNYALLARILEQRAGKTYRQIVQETVFDPLGMKASSATTWGDVTSVPEEKNGYMMELQTARGAGDIHSNAPDLLRFDRAFFAGKLISPNSVAAMLHFVDGYGCGWEESKHPDLVYHNGGTNSYSCSNIVFHASGRRTYLILLHPCWTSCRIDDDEEEEKSPEGAVEEPEARAEEEGSAILRLCLEML